MNATKSMKASGKMIAVGLTALLLAGGSALSQEAKPEADKPAAQDWNQWRGPNRNGAVAGPALLDRLDSDKGLSAVWTSPEFQGKGNTAGFASVSVAEGKAYLFASLIRPDGDGKEADDAIICINAADGTSAWTKKFPAPLSRRGDASSTPLVADGRVYAVGVAHVYCVSAADGTEVWKYPVNGPELASSPLLVDGKVILLSGELLALDAKDGRQVWKQPKVRGPYTSPVAWTGGGRPLVLCGAGKEVACVDPKDGAILWTVSGAGESTPVIEGDTMVFHSATAEIGLAAYKLSAAKAEKLWNQPALKGGNSTPVIWKGSVMGTTDKAFCVRLADGTIVWEEKFDFGYCSYSPLVADGKVLALTGGRGPKLIMFTAGGEKFESLGGFGLRPSACSSPSLADGRLYVRLADPKTSKECIACYDLRKK